MTPSGYPDASGTDRGLVSLLVQTFAGVKTFAAKIIAAAGIEMHSVADPAVRIGTGNDSSSSIAFYSTSNAAFTSFSSRTFVYSRNASFNIESSTGVVKAGGNQGLGPADTHFEISGAGSFRGVNGSADTDVCVKTGTSMADGTVHSSAKIWSARTGIGGTEVERAYLTKSMFVLPLGTNTPAIKVIGSSTYFYGADGTNGYIQWNGSLWHFNGAGVSVINTMTGGFAITAGVGVNAVGLVTSGSRVSLNVNDVSAYLTSTATAEISTPSTLAVGANVQLNTGGTARPTADAASRGKLWYSKSAGGAADTLQVCLKSAADTYSWVTIATG